MTKIKDMENCLSETAFAVKVSEGNYEIRWFTPKCEIDLCGHATFGTSYVLFRFYETDYCEVNGERVNISGKGALYSKASICVDEE